MDWNDEKPDYAFAVGIILHYTHFDVPGNMLLAEQELPNRYLDIFDRIFLRTRKLVYGRLQIVSVDHEQGEEGREKENNKL